MSVYASIFVFVWVYFNPKLLCFYLLLCLRWLFVFCCFIFEECCLFYVLLLNKLIITPPSKG